MRIVTEFPHAVREIEHVWIPLRRRLPARRAAVAARRAPRQRPVPAILEYIPYRKRDGTRERDEPMHRYFAGHGYAAVRVDLRGTGDSEGAAARRVPRRRSSDDALEVIALDRGASPGATGAVGMMGKSWGGFNALQVAARRPPELGAVITVCATDDRYADDAHYMGGCLLNENLIWGSVLFTLARAAARPGARRRGLARALARAARERAALPRALAAAPAARRLLAARLGVRGLSRAIQLPGLRRRRLGRRLHERGAAAARRPRRPRARGWSGRGRTSTRTTACPGRRSAFCRRRCAGGTTG